MMGDDRWDIDEPVSASHAGPQHVDAPEFRREVWGTRAGFILAAVGSAVGLGNMWRFPYRTAEGGGAAFVLLYIAMTLALGIPIMLAEMALGRRTRLSPIGALRKAAGRAWVPVGYLFVLAGLLILSYYSVIAGWATRYAFVGLISGFPGDPGTYFGEMASGGPAIAYHLAFMALTITIVMGGVEKGIERASFIMMPTLFALVAGLAVWASTLDGSGEGYSFYLSPNMDELLSLQTLAEAAGQAFFSLSLGMGAMLTFASYLSKHESLPRESSIIALSDFSVAFVAGLVVFPVIFALGLQTAVSDSTVGALFISLPGAFTSMGAVGRVIGTAFFLALFIGAITSAISLLEVVTSSLIDEWKLPRKKAAVGAGVVIALIGLLPATDTNALGAFDAIASNIVLPLGALGLALVVGWVMHDPIEEVADGAGPMIRRLFPAWIVILRFVAPVLLVLVLFYMVREAVGVLSALFAG